MAVPIEKRVKFMEKKDIYILGIESSCDETAAAVVKNGREVLSNIISSQVPIHRKFGGVVPEIASRKHIENVLPVIDEALQQAKVDIKEIAGDRPGSEALIALMAQDKKVQDGKMRFILARGIGESFVTSDVDPSLLKTLLDEALMARS